ncbi:MAG: O-antigen ligase family protein, partial [Giesbergeria sp.]
MASSTRNIRSNTNQLSHWLVFFLASALLGLAPVLRGGNRQIALVGLLLLSALLLAVLLGSVSFDRLFGAAGSTAERREKRRAVMPLWSALLLLFVASSPLWLGFLQLVPLSAGSWASLAGRGLYFDALAAAGGSAPQDLPLSLNPDATLTALLSGIPALATLLAALFLPRPLVEKCLVVLLVVGAFEMLLAVLQFWMGASSPLYFGADSATGFVGSFANRNHLADFLAMLMPLWFYRLAEGTGGRAARAAAHHRGTQLGGAGALWLFFGFALLVITLATLSRGALLSAALVLLPCTLLLIVKLKSKLSRKQQTLLAVAAAVFALLALAAVGAERVGQRLDTTTVQLDAQTRSNFTAATLDGARAFWPWGSGAGTFESVFPRFQAADSLFYIEYAHNDYAQLLM